jgi:integrase
MNRVWYPALRRLGFKRRKPYQTRHTTATLWLAAGENPEWIARQMGHSTTRMLFTVYSRFVPNLTRMDGSAFERLLSQNQEAHDDTE